MIRIDNIKKIFQNYSITEIGILPTSCLLYQKDHLLKNKDLFKSCIVFCIPYRTENNTPDNISKYSAIYDYHYYFKEFYENISSELSVAFPEEQFIGFSDHSPINERDAALKAGLGILGKNSMLINKRYGSYVFIGSIFSTLEFNTSPQNVSCCINCGKCVEACPTGAINNDFKKCLSYITQLKSKSDQEIEIIKSNKYIWGCDICQDVCPYNDRADYSSIEFFNKNIINHLTKNVILDMSDEEFQKRAFSWRGKKTIIDNLTYFDE